MNPAMNTVMISTPAVVKAVLPTWKRRLKLNSKPKANSRKMIPISDHSLMTAVSMMVGKRLKCGPTRKPATI